MTTETIRKTGIPAVGDMPWGTHFCLCYQTQRDLHDTVIPYFKAGLENHESCLWVIAKALSQKTKSTLRRAIPDFDKHLAAGSIEILLYSQWYLEGDTFDSQRAINGLNAKLAQALTTGCTGLRVAADDAWLGRKYWKAFSEYEKELDQTITGQRIIVLCVYPLTASKASAIFDVTRTHQFTIAQRNGSWEILVTPELKHARAELKALNDKLEQIVAERTKELETNKEALRHETAKRKHSEEERQAHLRFLESMDQVNRAMQGTNNLEQMMSDVLDAVLTIFDCDRAFLLYPCDPEAASWGVPKERNRPEYPGVFTLGLEMPMDPEVAETLRVLLESNNPVKFGPGTGHPLPTDVSEHFGFKSFMAMALHPKVGKPWQFGIHQCSYTRVWAPEEERLFQEIGRRLGDVLTSLLVHRNLQDSELRYREIFENTSDGILISEVTKDGRFKMLDFNPAWERIAGHSRTELVGRFLEDFSTDENIREVLEQYRVCLEKKVPIDFERELDNAMGHWYIHTTLIPVSNATGKIYRFVGVSRNITEHKRAEQIMQSRLRLMQFANTHSLDELLQATLDEAEALTGSVIGFYHFLDADQKMLTLQAWSTNTLEKMCTAEGKGRHYSIDEAGVWADCVRERRPVIHNDYTALPHRKGLPKGHAPVVRELVMPVFRGDKIVAILGVGNKPADYDQNNVKTIGMLADLAWDIVERKRAEEALCESEERYRLIAENTADTISVFDLDLKPIYVSPSVLRLLGYTVQEALTQSLNEMLTPESLQKAKEVLADQMELEASGKTDPSRTALLELEEYCKDGSRIWVELAASFIRDNNLKPTGIITITRDITRRKQADLQLIESEQKFRSLAESSPDSIIRYDTECRLLYVNRSMELTIDFNLAPKIGKRPTENTRFPDIKKYLAKLRQVIQTGQPDEMEVVVPNPAGELRTHHIRFVAERSNEGKIIGALAIGRDITDRKRMEEALRKSEAELKEAQRVGRLGSWDWDTVTHTITWSEEFYRIYGFDPKQRPLGYEEHLKAYTPESAARLDAAVRHSMQTGEGYQLDLKLVRPGGTRRWVTARGEVKRDTKGQIVGLRGTAQDITEHKRADEEVRRLTHAIEQSPVSVIMTNTAGEIEYVNPKFTEVTGYTKDEVRGQNPRILKSGETRLEEYKQLWETILAGKEWRGEFHNRKKNGELFWESASISAVRDEKGVISHFIAIKEDITERKRTEEEREKLQVQLNQAQKIESVGRLAGGVAHDFNNMLSVILGHADLALMKIDPAQPLYTDLQEIRKAAERSVGLTRQLLAFARKQTVAPRVLDLNETVEGMLKMLRRLIGEDIDLAWLPGAGVWPIKVDPSQIDQILANLCINARDAIARVGKVTIETQPVTFDEAYCADRPGFIPGEYVLLAVSDDGCGMDKETLNNLFEPFFTTKEIGKGTGLGLSMVYGIVRQNNGFINVYSEPGHGSTFKIYLPRHAAKTEQMRKESRAAPLAQGHETILLVEDEPTILEMARLMLKRLGYQVLAASTPGEAIRVAKEHSDKIHLLITDVVMPEMNGRDLAKNLLSLYPGLKRLFMSGYMGNVIAHHGVLDEGVHFIQKPFSMQTLAAKVREVLDSK